MQGLGAWLKQGRPFAPMVATVVVVALLALAAPLPEAAPRSDRAALEIDGSPSGRSANPFGESGAVGLGGAASSAGPGAAGGQAVGTTPGSTTTSSRGSSSGGTSPGASTAKTGVTYAGVTPTTVLWGFSAQDKGCGAFDQGAAATAYGGSSTPSIDYPAAMEYFNKYPLTDMVLPPEIRKGVNAKNGYWGRRITSVFRDSGGFACPDVGRANAVTFAEQDKVFGVVMRGNEGPEVPMSLVMAQHKRIFVGRQNVGPMWFKQRAPYFWDGMWGDGESEMQALGSWVCRDWVGKKAHDTGDPTVTGKDRKYGIPFPDVPDFSELAGILEREIARCGLKAKRYPYPADIATLETSAQTVISRMHQDEITSLLLITDWLTLLFLTQSATKQAWHPEWVRSGWGAGSYGQFYRLQTPDQSKNMWVAADAASPATPAYHQSEAYRAWKKVRPNAEPDGDWPSYYYQMRMVALGMAGAGPNLTPETFGAGMARVCNPCPRANALLPLEQLYPGKWTNLAGFTLARFNPDKPDPTVAADNTGRQPLGYFDFLENGKRYGRRITDPEPTR